LTEKSKVHEIGAGSGEATMMFADFGFEIICIEPGADMVESGALLRQPVADRQNDRGCVAFATILIYIIVEVIKMAKTANINIRIDPKVKSTVDGIFSHFGITVADAVNIFLHKVIIVGGLPFDMTLPKYNEDTLSAMLEARDIASGKIKTKSYASIKEMVAELGSEDLED